MLTCRKAAELLFDFLEHSLTPELQEAMELHLHGCSPCERFAASYEKTSKVCKNVLSKQAPGDVRDRLLNFLRRELRRADQ